MVVRARAVVAVVRAVVADNSSLAVTMVVRRKRHVRRKEANRRVRNRAAVARVNPRRAPDA